MSFDERKIPHKKLRQEIYEDAENNDYSIQPLGHEHLKSPLSYKNNDKTSKSIRFTPDDLCTSEKGSTIIEIKTKLSDSLNLSIELEPLEAYRQRTEDVYIVFETIKGEGLLSAKVCKATDILITKIFIPNRTDNEGKREELKEKYPNVPIEEYKRTDRGSGTPFVLIFPGQYKKWVDWDVFRNQTIVKKVKELKQSSLYFF